MSKGSGGVIVLGVPAVVFLDTGVSSAALTGARATDCPVCRIHGIMRATGRTTMHELAVTRSILDTVLEHALAAGAQRVLRIHLRVGALHEFKSEWIQRYFDRLSRDTAARDAVLVVEQVPAVFRCSACALEFELALEDVDRVRCPRCSAEELSLERGREFLIEAMEVE